MWVSDQSPYFMDTTLAVVPNDYHTLHKPTFAHFPWANGTVESLMRTVLAAFRCMMFELKLAPQAWKAIISAIPTIINSARLERLGNNKDRSCLSSFQVMTALIPSCTVGRIFSSNSDTLNGVTVTDVESQKLITINGLQIVLHQLHRDVIEKISKHRKKSYRRA